MQQAAGLFVSQVPAIRPANMPCDGPRLDRRRDPGGWGETTVAASITTVGSANSKACKWRLLVLPGLGSTGRSRVSLEAHLPLISLSFQHVNPIASRLFGLAVLVIDGECVCAGRPGQTIVEEVCFLDLT
jgi:hypothetical protein